MPAAIAGVFAFSFFNSASSASPSPPVAQTAPPSGFMSFSRSHYPAALDQDAPLERVGAHHVAHQFGTGNRLHFTPDVMKHISSL